MSRILSDIQCTPGLCPTHRIRRKQKKLLVKGFVSQENRDKGTGLSEFGDYQVPHQCVGKGSAGDFKPLPPSSFSLNFPSLRLGEMLAQYLNDPHQQWNIISKLLYSQAIGNNLAFNHRRCHQTWHFFSGFILLPTGQLNARANSAELESVPRTLQGEVW